MKKPTKQELYETIEDLQKDILDRDRYIAKRSSEFWNGTEYKKGEPLDMNEVAEVVFRPSPWLSTMEKKP